MIKLLVFTAAAAVLSVQLTVVPVLAQDRPPDNPGLNANITRWAAGKHLFRTIDDHRKRGEEHFRLSVHPDGTRTMMVWKDLFAGNSHLHIVMRVEPSFRPLEAYGNYWQRDGYKGSIRVVVDGDKLHATGWGPDGFGEHTLSVPQDITLVTHGEGLNAWAAWGDFEPGEQRSRIAYNISPIRNAAAPVLGSLAEGVLTFVGEERITTPAGTFETLHMSNGFMDVWSTKEDRILVLQQIKSRGLEYVLVELETGSN